MIRWWLSLALLLPVPAAAQEGFEADRLSPCLAGPGLIATCLPDAPQGQLFLATGADWSHHLLGIDREEGGPDWLVERRLTLRAEAGWTPLRGLHLRIGMDGAAHQQGRTTDGLGAETSLSAALGRSWLGARWDPWPGRWPVELGVETSLVLPSASRAGLTGPAQTRWSVGILASSRLGLFRPALNLGISLGDRAHFRDLTRDDSLYYRAGLELRGEDWPLGIIVEIYGVTSLDAPWKRAVDETLEVLGGLRFGAGRHLEILLAGGAGLVGASTPAARGLALLRWRFGDQKTPL